MMILALILAASAARAADIAPVAVLAAAPDTAPVGAPSVAVLKERFSSALEEADRVKALDAIAKTPPVTAQDVAALADLFSRYSDAGLRKKAMASLARINPDSPQLEPLFLNYLRQPEPETQLFGINGAFRLRSRQALPMIHKIAEKKFKGPDAASISVLTERNEWWTQYEALSALAGWEGEKVLPLLRQKAEESPAVARIIGEHFWKKILPDAAKWALSSSSEVRERAVEACSAQISPDDARATRDAMLAVVRDPKADQEVRHRLALKVGAVSTEAETDALVVEHDKATDDVDRLLFAAAVFAAHNPRSVPLLVRYAQRTQDEFISKGARIELVELVGEAKAAELVDGKKAP